MSNPRGRPATGRQTPSEAREALTRAGGKTITYRIKPDVNAALSSLRAHGYASDTAAIDAAILALGGTIDK